MSDRKLLELAAKAAGLEEFTIINGGSAVRTRHTGLQDWEPWDPLTDDGDALRLAVKLQIKHGNDGIRVSVDWWAADGITLMNDSEPVGDNPYAATRRAIVRAAAEVGRTK